MPQGKKLIDSWDKGVVTVSCARNYNYTQPAGGSAQIDTPYGLSSVIDVSQEVIRISQLSTPANTVWNNLNVDRDITYDWTTDISNFNNYCYWIWGGVASGGVGIAKEAGGYTSFVCSHGYYIHNTTGKGKYYLTTFYRMANPATLANDLSQIAFFYYNSSIHKTNLITPFPADNFSSNIYIVTNNGLNTNTTNTTPFWYWNRVGSETNENVYDPPNPTTNAFASGDLNTIFKVGETYDTDIARNIRQYLPDRVVRYEGGGTIFNNGFLDDEYYGVTNYTHQSGNWFGHEHDQDNEGGDGDGDNTQGGSTPNHVDVIPSDVTDTGFVRLYKSQPVDLRGLANFLFASLTDAQAIVLKKLLSNPLDYIICLNACHFDVTPSGEYESIKIGGIDTTVQSRPVKQFVHLSGGSYTINHYWGSYLDYAPFTTIQIHVPYCGTHTLDTDMVMNSTLTLDYEIDLLSGTLVAQLSISKPNDLKNQPDAIEGKVIETYTGNVFTQIPIANTDYRQMIASVLGIASAGITSVASASPLPLASGVANAVTNSKVNVQKQGSISNNYGYMSHQSAFLIISRPCLTMSGDEQTKYHDWMGYPCNMVKTVGDFSGVLTIQKGTFWSGDNTNPFTSITDTEKDEIAQLLEGGICV